MKYLILLITTACSGVVSNHNPTDAGTDSGVTIPVDSGVTDASTPACECPLTADKPSPSGRYIGPCGDFDLYVEPAIGIPNELFVCVPRGVQP